MLQCRPFICAGLSAREKMRLKRLAKQSAKRGASSIAAPNAKRAKGDPTGSVVRIGALNSASR